MPILRVAACQIDTVMGDLDGNVDRILAALEEAEGAGCDLAVTPELAITGYPPEDLVLKPGFVDDNLAALEQVARATGPLACTAVVGFVDRGPSAKEGGFVDRGPSGHPFTCLFNAAAVLHGGEIKGVYYKRLLPNYAVFDEKRYFEPGAPHQRHFRVAGVEVAVLICEDIWEPGPAAAAAAGGATVIAVLNGSPYYHGRLAERTTAMARRAQESGCHVVYVNLVGGQDELVFDGASLVLTPDGSLLARAPQFREDVLVADLDVPEEPRKKAHALGTLPQGPPTGGTPQQEAPPRPEACMVTAARNPLGGGAPGTRMADLLDPLPEVYEALVLGTRDYVIKNGFTDALVAMSGGIDSSLVAVVAADALGPGHVHGVAMPSRYSSEGSLSDAEEVANRLGIDYRVIPIEAAHVAFLAMVGAGKDAGLAEENLQSRIRGVSIMYLSNENGWIVLTTGNKSEMAVGYSTIYGDTAGGFAVIKDVPKTLVYDLCRFRNGSGRGGGAGEEEQVAVVSGAPGTASLPIVGGPVIPESVLVKPPSAELRPDQRDDDSLPPYEILDPVLQAYVEGDATVGELVERGFDPSLATRVARLVDVAEYKRRQNPPGVRVTPKAFGKDRRMPITNRYRGTRRGWGG